MSLDHWVALSRFQALGQVRVWERKPGVWECRVLELDDVSGPTSGLIAASSTADEAVMALVAGVAA
jgi:hypothetical protein